VHTEPSDMSFSVSVEGHAVEWSSTGLAGLFATPSNVASPAFYSMISDMMRFNK
jgi:predicted NAD/FAD-binding protein